jgi:hypothetical protein
MKVTTLLLAMCYPFVMMAQSESSEKSVKKDNVIIDVYVGGPQLLSRLSSTRDGSFGSTFTLTSKGFGPFGGRVEYMFTPKSSIGFEVNHATSTLTSSGDDGYDKYSEELKISRTRFFPRYALHFGKNKLDAYFHVGLGVAIWSIDLKVIDPSQTVTSTTQISRASGPALAFRTGVGLRYFFTDNFGLNADFGLGGALFTGGVTVKL